MTGNISSINFSAETIFNKVSEKISSLSSTTINYSLTTSTLYSNLTGGPFTYNITNVPDLSTNSHFITILSKGSSTNYGNVITVNSTAYTLQWSNGDNPTTSLTGIGATDIITQQICILPRNFNGNSAISNISVFKSLV